MTRKLVKRSTFSLFSYYLPTSYGSFAACAPKVPLKLATKGPEPSISTSEVRYPRLIFSVSNPILLGYVWFSCTISSDSNWSCQRSTFSSAWQMAACDYWQLTLYYSPTSFGSFAAFARSTPTSNKCAHKGTRQSSVFLQRTVSQVHSTPNWMWQPVGPFSRHTPTFPTIILRPRGDSNPQSSDPKSDALSIRPRGLLSSAFILFGDRQSFYNPQTKDSQPSS